MNRWVVSTFSCDIARAVSRVKGSLAVGVAASRTVRVAGRQRQYSTHAVGDSVELPKTKPASIFVKQRGQPDGDTSSGRGAIVYDHRATSATFNELTTSQSDFYLHQHAKVPSRGSAAFQFAYVQAFTQDTVKSLARLSKRRFRR